MLIRLNSALHVPHHFHATLLGPRSYSSIRSHPVPLTPFIQPHLTTLSRNIATESHRSTPPPPPPISASSSESVLKSSSIAVPPPGSPPPPLPPVPLDINPPRAGLAEEKASSLHEVTKEKAKKVTGSLPARAWATVKKEAAHYWAGTRLLGQEIRITSKIQWKVLNGGTLTRRERRQVNNNVSYGSFSSGQDALS